MSARSSEARGRRARIPPPHESRSLGKAAWICFGLALALRLLGVAWGLPEVFEEAYPLKLAWTMWGFDGSPWTLNPGFFHYPSLVIDLEFLVLGAVRAVLRLAGAVPDATALRATYATDPSVFYVAGRTLIALFGALVTIPVYWIARQARGAAVAVVAALLVACNPVLIRQSQLINVDMPLVFLVAAALAATLAFARSEPTRQVRLALLAGALVGLATSAKYPGILALVPLLAAWTARTRRWRSPDRVRELALILGAALLAFALTSPFFFLDWRTALKDLTAERVHLQLGHFGSESGSSWGYYARAWFAQGPGWLAGAAACAGFVQFALVRRERWAVLLGLFLVPLVLLVGSEAVKADRYLLPAIPLGIILAAAWLAWLASSLGRRPLSTRDRVLIVALCVLADGGRIATLARQLGPDSRTEARLWIDRHLPAGSLVVVEPYGPNLTSPATFMAAGTTVPAHGVAPLYFTLPIPMFQVEPERSAVYYDPRLYTQADAWVVSGALRDRYLAEPARFPVQNAYYRWLGEHWSEAARFRMSTGTGPEIVIYVNPDQDRPFMQRVGPPPTPTEFMYGTGGADGEAAFYRNLALSYFGFGRYAEAVEAYRLGLMFPPSAGATRQQMMQGLAKSQEALASHPTGRLP